MSNLLKIEGYSGLVRDQTSGSILNVDNHLFGLFKERKEEKRRQIDKVCELEREINNLKMLVNKLISKVELI